MYPMRSKHDEIHFVWVCSSKQNVAGISFLDAYFKPRSSPF